MRWWALALLILAPLSARAACDSPDPHDCLVPRHTDFHNHGGTPQHAKFIDDNEAALLAETECAHQYLRPETICRIARENGADFLNISWHDSWLSGNGRGVGWDCWTSTCPASITEVTGTWTGDTWEPSLDVRGYEIPGAPGTFTTNELEWLMRLADTEDVQGKFNCTGGVELTRSHRSSTSTFGESCREHFSDGPTGVANCGGHKTAVVPPYPDQPVQDGIGSPGDADYTEHETDFYAWLQRNRGVGILAHPCASLPADLLNRADSHFLGGFRDDVIVAMEGGNTCERANGHQLNGEYIETWQYALAQGYNLALVSGSDFHGLPSGEGTGRCDGADLRNQKFFENAEMARTYCWVASIGDEDIRQALLGHRCGWAAAGAGKPWMKISAGTADDGQRRVPSGGTLNVDAGATSFHVVVEMSLGRRYCEQSPNDYNKTCSSDADCEGGAGVCVALSTIIGDIELRKADTDAVVATQSCPSHPCTLDTVLTEGGTGMGGTIAGAYYARDAQGTPDVISPFVRVRQ